MNYQVKFHKRSLTLIATILSVIITPIELWNFQQNYDNYYELSLTLLRKGGIIAIDNVLWRGLVVRPFRCLMSIQNYGLLKSNMLKQQKMTHQGRIINGTIVFYFDISFHVSNFLILEYKGK